MTEQQLTVFLKKVRMYETPMSFLFGFLAMAVAIGTLVAYLPKLRSTIPIVITADKTPAPTPFTTLPEKPVVDFPANYIVQDGDSSWKIAEAFYGDGNLYTIIEAQNALKKDQDLAKGLNLRVPSPTATMSGQTFSLSANKMYVTNGTDTLWKIAQQFYNDGNKWNKIYEANKAKIPNPNSLEKDVQLVIPE